MNGIRLLVALALTACLGAGLASSALAKRPAGLDKSFGKQGRVVVNTTARSETVLPGIPGAVAEASASGPGGRLYVASGQRVLGFLANGRHDPRFDSVELAVPAGSTFLLGGIAVDSAGRVLVAGVTQSGTAAPGPAAPGPAAPPPASAAVYRFLPSGQPDPSFGIGGEVVSSFGQLPPTGPGPAGKYPFTPVPGNEFPYSTATLRVAGVAVDRDDRPVVSGASVNHVTACTAGIGGSPFTAYQTRTFVARLTSGGIPDASFGSGGVLTDDYYESPIGPATTSEGGVALANPTEGPCLVIPEDKPATISVLNPDGSLAHRFFSREEAGSQAERRLQTAAIAVDHRNRIVTLANEISGSGETAATEATVVSRWLPSGRPDRNFGHGGFEEFDLGRSALSALAIDDHNRAVLAGSAARRGGGRSFLVMRLTATGMADSRFGRGGQTTTGFLTTSKAAAASVSLDERGRIVLGGTLTSPLLKTGYGLALARYMGGN
ncbi:MAG TPA: hypothetical protein VMS11_12825 [Solirubrobacterales bacterium]|nr:hypothetical protein [Solirubrobacterales bacterium]